MKYYRMFTYDVWKESYGNIFKEWHWQVNDVYNEYLIVAVDDERCHTDKELAREIRNAINPMSRTRFNIEGELEYTLYIERERDGKPLFELRSMSEEEIDDFLSGRDFWRNYQVAQSRESAKKRRLEAKA